MSYDRSWLIWKIFAGIFTAITLVSTSYFYVVKRKSDKPKFITAIFVMLNLIWPIIIVSIVIPYDFTFGSTKYWVMIAALSLMYECIPLAHWTFAIYYFKVAISTSVFI